MTDDSTRDVIVVGGGVAGLTAAIYLARADLDALVVDHHHSILRRNAHLENVPGFPAGVDARLFLEMTHDQAEQSGAEFADGEVTRVEDDADGFLVHTAGDDRYRAERVVAASWSDSDYLEDLPVELEARGSKQFVPGEPNGRTAVEGLYAAGRIADQYHQTVVAAGHGAQVAITLLHDAEVPFYHDWVVPEGYFTGRGREVPPGCEEIDDEERRRRERRSRETMREYFAEPPDGEPVQHPSVAGDRDNP